LLAVEVRRGKEEVRWGEEGWKRFINECGSRQAGRAGMRAVWSGLFEQQLGFGRRWLGLSTAPVLLLLAHVEAVGIRLKPFYILIVCIQLMSIIQDGRVPCLSAD